MKRTIAAAAVLAASVGAHALQTAPPPAPGGSAAPGAPAATPPAMPPAGAKSADGAAGVAAMWKQQVVTWDRLRPVLAELAGSQALEEVLLDAMLEDRARERGIAPDETAIAREEETLRGYLDRDPARADRLLSEVRARQGLGPARWRALLRRNAILRAMVAADVTVQDEQVRAAHDAAHGPRRRARVIAVPDLRAAQAVADRLARGERFEDIAAALSTDPSAARGGLVNAMSRLDPGVPASVREALWALAAPGTVSPPALVGTGYLLVRFEGEDPGDGVALEAVRAEAERAVRLAQERARMDTLAQDMLRGAEPVILDDSLADAWSRVRTGATRSGQRPPG
ncbi:MAG: peptidyl-prolyl cis-trans isomerase [Planctomycetota bacterium]